MAARIVVFDAYGTLFDIGAAARETAAAWPTLADREAALSRIWREKQVGYSWWRAVTGDHVPFWQVTGEALDYALEATGLHGVPGLRAALMETYRHLAPYPEGPATLDVLRDSAVPAAILSNGSPDMLEAAVAAAGIGDALDAVLSVEAVGVFKPASRVYDMIGARYGTAPAEVLFVSSNGWDVAAAAGYGFRTVWVNRAGLPVDRLPHGPAHIVDDLTPIPDLAIQERTGLA